MKLKPQLTLLPILFFMTQSVFGDALIEMYTRELKDSAGNFMPDANTSTWFAVLDTFNDGLLPGGLLTASDNALTTLNAATIAAHFTGRTISVGQLVGINGSEDQIFAAGSIGDIVPGFGLALPVIPPELTNGRPYAIYWIPGNLVGATLSGTYELGGFFRRTPEVDPNLLNPRGMVTPPDAFNELTVFTPPLDVRAIIIPEPSSLMLSVLGIAALLRRSRRA